MLMGIASLFFITNNLNADTIISWDGDVVTNHVNLILPTPVDNGQIRTWEYDFDTPILSTSGAYSGPEIFGVLQNLSGKGYATNFSVARIENSGTNDVIRIRGNADTLSGETNIITGMIFFKPDVESGDTVSFTASSSMTLGASVPGGSPRQIRMSVLNDGVWYLSSSSNSGGFTISDASAEMWGVWDPTITPLSYTSNPSITYDTLGSTFTNIQAAGLWYTSGRAGPSQEGRLDVSGFLVNATVTPIPEPSTGGILLLIMVGLTSAKLISQRHK